MPYTPQTWQDDNISLPLSATRMSHLETGIDDIDARVAALEAGGGSPVVSNIFNGSTWPTRPTATMVLWVGGAPADAPTSLMHNGDVWYPGSA